MTSPAADAPKSAWQQPRVRVFLLTWLAYGSYYLGRKNFSVAKTTLEEQVGLSPFALGLVDTGYLAAYAVSQFACGWLGDRIGPRRLVGIGMILSGWLVATSGLSSTALGIALPFTLNGLAQASGWPGTVQAMAPFFSATERGRVMGLWSTCYQVGGLVAGAVTAWLLGAFGWRTAFLAPAAWVAAVGGAVLLWLPEAPAPATPPTARTEAGRALLRSPALWALGGSYFCLKLIRYALLFWLPYYLEKQLGYARTDAGYRSLAFEAGGVLGSIAVGAVSDRIFGGRRGLAGLLGCVGLGIAIAAWTALAAAGPAANFVGLATIGFWLFGPDALISGVAAQDLGGPEATSRAAGFINGVGSFGAVLQGVLIAAVSARFGWGSMLWGFVGLAWLAALGLLPRVFAERRIVAAAP